MTNSYFARLAEMSGTKVNAHKVDTNSTKALVDGNPQSGEENTISSLYRTEEDWGFDTSASESEKEELSPETFSKINMKHKNKTSSTSTSTRKNTKINPSYLGGTVEEDFISASDLSSAITEKSESVGNASSISGSVVKRDKARLININEDKLSDSEARGNGYSSKSSVPHIDKNINPDENRQLKGYLKKLLDMPSIKNLTVWNENKASESSTHLPKPTYDLHNLTMYDPNAKKPSLKGDISISIGTIVLNVTKVNNENSRNQISIQKSDSNQDSNPSRLHRYYGICHY
jgi:hypothetical protein